MVYSPVTKIGRISQQLLSSVPQISKPQSLSAFQPLLVLGEAQIQPEMYMASLRGFTRMRAISVSIHPFCACQGDMLMNSNEDIVGNNIPVFFIQDAIRFPDLIHAVKPSPDNEIPQAATAHDTAWDFFSQQPSALHTLFWAMAGFGIPRSYRHMDGFGVHTFRFVTDDGTSKLIKWHWKTKQGKASLVWEEAQVLSGKNADFHRQDLWDAIASGNSPEWEVSQPNIIFTLSPKCSTHQVIVGCPNNGRKRRPKMGI